MDYHVKCQVRSRPAQFEEVLDCKIELWSVTVNSRELFTSSHGVNAYRNQKHLEGSTAPCQVQKRGHPAKACPQATITAVLACYLPRTSAPAIFQVPLDCTTVYSTCTPQQYKQLTVTSSGLSVRYKQDVWPRAPWLQWTKPSKSEQPDKSCQIAQPLALVPLPHVPQRQKRTALWGQHPLPIHTTHSLVRMYGDRRLASTQPLPDT